jgi:hypothetical protein
MVTPKKPPRAGPVRLSPQVKPQFRANEIVRYEDRDWRVVVVTTGASGAVTALRLMRVVDVPPEQVVKTGKRYGVPARIEAGGADEGR